MLKKLIITSVVLSSMFFSSIVFADSIPVNGWYFNEGQQATMYFLNGQKYANNWYLIDGYWYYFNDCGFMSKGHVHMNNKEYTFGRDGKYIGEGFLEIPPLVSGARY